MLVIFLSMLASSAAQPAASIPPKPQKICRESEQEVGSHIRSGRRCKTAEEWQIEDQAHNARPPSMRVTEGQGDSLTKQNPQ
jgi:hypothetical protein